MCEIASTPESPTELTEQLAASTLDSLEAMQERGAKFDFYCIDTGWNEPLGDLTEFHQENFPDGPSKILHRIKQLGMKTLLWMSPSGGPAVFRPHLRHPFLDEAHCGHPAHELHCPAAPHWHETFRKSVKYHIHENGIRGFKFDGMCHYCSKTDHGHLPCKYGVEAIVDQWIETLEQTAQACPDVLLMLYWGFTSPWWLLYVDTIYERGMVMEGATPSELPAPSLRQSSTVSLDQAHDYNWDRIPVRAQDSLGVWISETPWGSWMGKDGWQDAFVMDVARGNMMSQLWGEIGLFDEQDEAFLARLFQWLDQYSSWLANPRRILGSPWRAGAYGYACFKDDEGAIFIYNAQYVEATVDLCLDATLGFEDQGCESRYCVWSLHPEENMGLLEGASNLSAGDTFEIRLKPFEVRMLHVSSRPPVAQGQSRDFCSQPLSFSMKEQSRSLVPWSVENVQGILRKVVNGQSHVKDLPELIEKSHVHADHRDRDVSYRQLAGHLVLPAGPTCELHIAVRLSRQGVCWHHNGLFEIVRLSTDVADG